MDLSEARIESIRWSGTEDERWYVSRLFERPAAYRRWERFHFGLMKQVAETSMPERQILELRKAHFWLMRRQALFEHLRDAKVRGHERDILVSAFHQSVGFSKAILLEYEDFFRANSSLLCASYLGSTLVNDARFNAEFVQYRRDYMEFFSLYCDWLVADSCGTDFPLRPMISLMKKRLTRVEANLVALPVAADRRRSGRSFWH